MMLMTVLAILAVDFKVFPRSLAKCESFGVSLVSAQNVLSPRTSPHIVSALDGHGRWIIRALTGHSLGHSAREEPLGLVPTAATQVDVDNP